VQAEAGKARTTARTKRQKEAPGGDESGTPTEDRNELPK
jgi:hypothetical protein